MEGMLEACSSERRRAFEVEAGRLVTAPEDDMWAAFADQSSSFLLCRGGERIGCAAFDETRVLHRFSLMPRFEDRGEEALRALVKARALSSAVPSTADPAFLALCLSLGGAASPVALMFHHALEPEGEPAALRPAKAADHAASLAFARAAMGAPESFLGPYLSERIARGELRLLEDGGAIVASGELRLDRFHDGAAHLGVIVGAEQRGRGLGRRVLGALVRECRRRGLAPVCSTEPENAAARRAIQAAGFRSRHRIFRVSFESDPA